MSKFSDLSYHILEEYFNQSISQGERNDNFSGPYHRYYTGSKSNDNIVYDDGDMVASHLQGNRQSITAIGGYWTRLWIKVVDLEGKVPDYPGFVEFKFRVNNNYLEGDNFIFDKGSMLTVAASANSTEFTSGSEVYFKKGTYLYEWLVKNSTTYKDFFNTNKTFCYFGKIYPHKDQTNSYHIIFDGMKNYVMNALPRENRSDNLTEFMRLYFDKIYQKIYNKMKDIPSLLDAKEIDINLIDYMSKAYLIDTDINLTETALREWTENLVYLLKRKGTYSALWIIWKTFLKNTLNVLNIYNRWHENPDLFTYDVDVPLGKFIDVLHELDYGIMPDGCAGSYWYSKVLTAISPGHIFIQNTPSTIWYISHNMFTKEIMIQCYDHAYNRIWPASVKSVSTGMVKVIFGTAVYGHAYLMRKGDFTHIQNNIDASWIITHNLGQKEVLSQYRDTDYNKIIPDEVILNTINHINTTFGTATAGSVTVRDEVLDVNLKVITNPVASTTWNMEHGFATSGVLTDDIGVFVQLFDDSDTMIKPLSLTLIDGNNCRAVFDSAKSGYAVIKASKLSEIVLPDYNLDNMILSPHYKLEMDLSCEPIDDDVGYILKKETIDRLIKNWELMRPVSRTSYYHELISPKVDFTGQYKSLYSKGYNAYLYSKFCASAAEFLPSPSADTLYFKQYVNEEVWKINHTLDTDDFIIQCYDSENNRIWPDEAKTIGNNNVELYFGHAINGVVCLVKTESGSVSGNTLYFSDEYQEQWEVQHNLGTVNILNQFDDSTRTKMMPSGISLIDDDNALAIWNENNENKGYSLSSAISYVHNELSPSEIWTINHKLNSNSIVSQFFDYDNNLIQANSLTLNDSDYCTATFSEATSGFCIIRPIYKKITEADIMYLLENYGYWELGNGTTGSTYDPMISNGTESVLISGGVGTFDYASDNDYYYLSQEISDLESDTTDWEITELAWLTIIDGVRKVRFYSYFSPIHKPGQVWFNTHLRIEKQQA